MWWFESFWWNTQDYKEQEYIKNKYEKTWIINNNNLSKINWINKIWLPKWEKELIEKTKNINNLNYDWTRFNLEAIKNEDKLNTKDDDNFNVLLDEAYIYPPRVETDPYGNRI